jgi:hypothetical protein
MVTVLSAIYIGALLSEAFGAPLLKITRGLQVVGAGLLLWATLWELGWGFRSWVGESLPERVHRWIFRGFESRSLEGLVFASSTSTHPDS